ncbi:MAG: NifU family protein [Candidatus Actinomarina sp.]|jgi:Fe/S biogenesis protein NfuA|nr:NifU family protein [Candidatus Actinomarina sp.]MDG1228309.1 NifU family protein [Candidatus Actinomarina sp.]MDG1740840.1 NifU family protein [Candidatus Actinomarina sp.]MDG2082538.1 NifU family protein [Candidatus Actinomarina sp.]|tara:strand:+ start:10601 stop:11230 length:630 start_codon:yes stop_codon:yes gene_type:complete
MTDFKFDIGEKAIAKILEIKEQEPGDNDYALFLQIDGVQGNQYTYDLSFLDLEQARSDDKRLEFGDLVVIIASKDLDKFNNSKLELSDDPAAPGLTMDNPNTPSPEIFGNPDEMPELTGELAEKVQTVLESQINPAIASHGGVAQLVGVEGQDIYLKLGGGCQGCGMAQVTLTQGIETSLREAIPEIGNIIDATDHASGDNPYFESAKK